MELKKRFIPLFKENGLVSFASFMNFSGGDTIKKITLRSITKFYLTKDGITTGFYLKRHSRRPRLYGHLKGMLTSNSPSEAKNEFDAIEALTKAGVPCAQAVAFGERNTVKKAESFLVTEALDGYTQLEKMVFDFTPPLSKVTLERKRALIKEVAVLVAKLHNAGFNHKDLYLTHILAKYDAQSGYDLKLIDLQRVDYRTKLRRRWLVKDIAALNYSSPKEIVTRTDRLRFYKAYTGKAYIDREDRAFLMSVEQKTARIAAHTVKMYKRRALRVEQGKLPR